MLVENKVLAEFAELIREKKTQPYSGEKTVGNDTQSPLHHCHKYYLENRYNL